MADREPVRRTWVSPKGPFAAMANPIDVGEHSDEESEGRDSEDEVTSFRAFDAFARTGCDAVLFLDAVWHCLL